MILCFQLKPCVKYFPCLNGFKLKMMVVKPKMTQPVEPDEEPVDLFNSTGRRVQKSSLSSRTLVQPIQIEPQSIDVRSKGV